MESSNRNIKLGGAVKVNGFSYVSKSEVESKLLCEHQQRVSFAEVLLRMYGARTEKKVRKGEGETREEGEISQRQRNESANESLPCTAGRSQGGTVSKGANNGNDNAHILCYRFSSKKNTLHISPNFDNYPAK